MTTLSWLFEFASFSNSLRGSLLKLVNSYNQLRVVILKPVSPWSFCCLPYQSQMFWFLMLPWFVHSFRFTKYLPTSLLPFLCLNHFPLFLVFKIWLEKKKIRNFSLKVQGIQQQFLYFIVFIILFLQGDRKSSSSWHFGAKTVVVRDSFM